MKTKLLQWDVTLQTVLVLLSLGIIFLPLLWYFLLVPIVMLWAYQLLSNCIHLLLNHKSIGYTAFRKLYFFASIAYPVFVYLYMEQGMNMPTWVGTVTIFITPVLIVGLYYYLCYSELQYLKHREFFILK